jgi:hypothetical protein
MPPGEVEQDLLPRVDARNRHIHDGVVGSPVDFPMPGRSIAIALTCRNATAMTWRHVCQDSGQPCRNRNGTSSGSPVSTTCTDDPATAT